MNTIIKVASAAGAITLAALSVYGSFGLCQHIIIAVDHWGNAAPGPTKPAVDATTDLLDLIRRPCASVDKNGHLLPDGPICEIDQAIHDIRKIIVRLPQKRQTLMFSATMPGEMMGTVTRTKTISGRNPSERPISTSPGGACIADARTHTKASGKNSNAYAKINISPVWYSEKAYRVAKKTRLSAMTTPGTDWIR